MKSNLSSICDYRKEKIQVSTLDLSTYISTENMLPNRGGITFAASLPTTSQTQAFFKGDVLVSNIRPYFKKIWQATFDGGCSNDVLVFTARQGVQNAFLYYILSDDAFFDYAMATSKGTKMPRGDKTAIMNYQVPNFGEKEQKCIASILRSFDEKIELNNRINENLFLQLNALYSQTCAEAVFHEKALGSLCQFQEGYVNPSQTHPEYFNGDIKWLRAVDINESFIIETSRTLTQSGFQSAKKSAYLFPPDTIAISKSGTIGRLGIVGDFMCGNRAVINIKPNDPILLPFIFSFLKSRQNEFPELAVGSVQKNLYVSLLEPLIVRMPDSDNLLKFCNSGNAILNTIKNNCRSNILLRSLRDALLPKLMSGELNVSELDL